MEMSLCWRRKQRDYRSLLLSLLPHFLMGAIDCCHRKSVGYDAEHKKGGTNVSVNIEQWTVPGNRGDVITIQRRTRTVAITAPDTSSSSHWRRPPGV